MTERVGEFIIDAGPDALLVQKPAAVALCNELGLGDRLIPTKLPRTAFVLRNGELHSLPGASILGFPTRLKPLFRSTLFGLHAKFRMAAELVIPRAPRTGDESIAGFVRRRFGPEAVTYIAEPLLAGIHAGDVERLSMRALFPRLVDAEARAGSVIRAFRREPRPVNSDGVFRSFPNGLAELIDGLMKAVPKESVRCGSNVTRIEEGRRLHDSRRGQAVDTRARGHPRDSGVCGRRAAAPDRRGSVDGVRIDPLSLDRNGRLRVSARCGSAQAERHRLRRAAGRRHQHHGRRVDLVEVAAPRARRAGAAARVSRRRARSGRARRRRITELTNAALGDLTKILGIRGLPIMTRVYRWNRSSPQQEVGHGASDAAHRREARGASRAVRLGRGVPRRRHSRLHRRCASRRRARRRYLCEMNVERTF